MGNKKEYMNRAIKFRVWDKNIPTTKEVHENLPASGGMVEWGYVKESNYLTGGINGLYPMMQFTGLTDKSGKEIYDGDVVKSSHGTKYEVKYQESAAYFGFEVIGSYETRMIHEMPSGVEIIGNIYENPELLK